MNDEAAKLLAEEHKMTYFKTSAFKGENIQEMVSFIIKQVYELKIKPEMLLEQQQ